MTLARFFAFWRPRLLLCAAGLACAWAVHASDYPEVSQLMRAGKLAEAMTKVEQTLAAKPRDVQLRFLKGVIQRDLGQNAEAIATFTRLTEEYPELPEPYNNLAVLHAGQGQFDKARAALEMAIRTNPSYATAHENLGDVYARLAGDAYNKALQLDSANTAVPPKLALIRELAYATPPAKGQRPTPPVPPPPPVAPASAPVKPPPPPVVVASAPVKPPVPPPPPPPPKVDNSHKDVEATVYAWAKAWSGKDLKAYFAAYGREFTPPGALSRSAWENERRDRIGNKSNISVKIAHLAVTVTGNKASARFLQDYKAGSLAVSSRKTLDLLKVGERWLIVRETTGN